MKTIRTEKKKNIHFFISTLISIIALCLTIYSLVQTNITNNKELITFSNVIESDYFFDDEQLYKEISFIVSNNSQISISLVDFELLRGGSTEDIIYDNNISYNLPINLAANTSLMQRIRIKKDITNEQLDNIIKKFGTDCYIDSYTLYTFLEFGDNPPTYDYKINTTPGLNMVFTTSKNNQFTYQSLGGGSAEWIGLN